MSPRVSLPYSSATHDDKTMGACLPDRQDLARILAEGTVARSTTKPSQHSGNAPTPDRKVASVALPSEILLQIAHYLVQPAPNALPFASSHEAPASATASVSMMPAEHQEDKESFLAVLALSSLSVTMRQLLAPLIWQEVLIQRTDRLGKLRTIAEYYQRLASSFSEVGRLVYPLPLVRVLRIQLPDRYLSFDQEILRHLLRSGINPSNSLHTLVWDSELLPGPAIWRMLGEDEKMPGLEAQLHERKQKTLNRDQIREIANSGRGEGIFVPRNSHASSTSHSERIGRSLRERVEALSLAGQGERCRLPAADTISADDDLFATPSTNSPRSRSRSRSPGPVKGLQSLSLHCKVFYGGHIEMGRLRSLRHLHLTSFESHLLPPHLPSLLISLHRPLKSISLSSSKTSLLHDWDLIQRGVFRGLEWLDVYPVTPEWPLAEGLRSAGGSLRGLRLILDVSGSFGHFDRLWKDLSSPPEQEGEKTRVVAESCAEADQSPVGALPHLEWLIVDPFPQQNTAPSFEAFLKSCPRLRWLNGRKVDHSDGAPPGLDLWDFNPDKLSGAFPY